MWHRWKPTKNNNKSQKIERGTRNEVFITLSYRPLTMTLTSEKRERKNKDIWMICPNSGFLTISFFHKHVIYFLPYSHAKDLKNLIMTCP